MEYGKIKIGDTVKFTDEAKREISHAVDSKEHVVSSFMMDNKLVMFKDGTGSDVYWLHRIESAVSKPTLP